MPSGSVGLHPSELCGYRERSGLLRNGQFEANLADWYSVLVDSDGPDDITEYRAVGHLNFELYRGWAAAPDQVLHGPIHNEARKREA